MKERLTKREKNGLAYFPMCFTPPCNGEGYKDENCIFISDVCERLAEYEDLNDQIRAMFGDAVTLKDCVDSLEKKVREPEKPDPVNARILTYEESDMWDAYRTIGTPEQCREAMNKQKRLPVNNQEGDSYYFLTGDCPVCGFRMIARANYCINCGQRLSYKDASAAEIINDIIRVKNNPLATLAIEMGIDHIAEASKKAGDRNDD